MISNLLISMNTILLDGGITISACGLQFNEMTHSNNYTLFILFKHYGTIIIIKLIISS